ncbi:MAG TPA: YciI family protein [Polyangiaceae bacterium]|jgi:hypothetical protein|nr:YciI family protein [Polyangiaceae bacterium]
MKFLMTYEGTDRSPPTPARMAAIAEFSDEMAKSGILLMTGGLQRPTKGTHVKQSGDAFSVTDGPFAETKELIDGFALIRVGSKEQALDVARRFMQIAGDGVGEILQVFDAADIPPAR